MSELILAAAASADWTGLGDILRPPAGLPPRNTPLMTVSTGRKLGMDLVEKTGRLPTGIFSLSGYVQCCRLRGTMPVTKHHQVGFQGAAPGVSVRFVPDPDIIRPYSVCSTTGGSFSSVLEAGVPVFGWIARRGLSLLPIGADIAVQVISL
ncbi:MAG: hypothetical protein MZV63_60465 [Marinilabiliales bacterium]|nr:hypothetical protein [Marinilabiliales bacterium]